jgi:hypothetical protein
MRAAADEHVLKLLHGKWAKNEERTAYRVCSETGRVNRLQAVHQQLFIREVKYKLSPPSSAEVQN